MCLIMPLKLVASNTRRNGHQSDQNTFDKSLQNEEILHETLEQLSQNIGRVPGPLFYCFDKLFLTCCCCLLLQITEAADWICSNHHPLTGKPFKGVNRPYPFGLKQPDQIGLFLNGFGDKFSYKICPNFRDYFENITFHLKTAVGTFWASLGENWANLLFCIILFWSHWPQTTSTRVRGLAQPFW